MLMLSNRPASDMVYGTARRFASVLILVNTVVLPTVFLLLAVKIRRNRLVGIHRQRGRVGRAGQIARPAAERVTRIRRRLQRDRLAGSVAGLVRRLGHRAVRGADGQSIVGTAGTGV